MVRHSKNNTASATFTKAEYGMLQDVWGSKKTKLGAESMKNFDQCNLCLATLKNPVSCSQGHLFCRECILSSLLDQKRDAASLQITLERLENEHKEERLRVRQEAMRKVQQDFERIQSGSRRSHDRGRQESESPAPHNRDRSRSPDSRNGTLKDLPARIAAQTERAIADAMDKVDQQHAQSKRDKIPAYWLPSLTPSADTKTEDIVRQTEAALAKGMTSNCYVADKFGHPVSIKSLIDVHFVEGHDHDHQSRKICPSCRKTLSNVTHLTALRRCGHVHCTACVDTLIRPALQHGNKQERPACISCSKIVKDEGKDLVQLQREGTGFASGGKSETEKKGVAFQG